MDVTLIDGRILPESDIQLDSDGWNFSRVSSGERLTYKIKLKDKIKLFPTYNVTAANYEISKEIQANEGKFPVGELPTNVTLIVAKQLLTDPLDAPAEFASDAVDKVKEVVKSPVTWVAVGLIVTVVAVIVISRYTPRP